VDIFSRRADADSPSASILILLLDDFVELDEEETRSREVGFGDLLFTKRQRKANNSRNFPPKQAKSESGKNVVFLMI
jgi:hypothetical protein